MEDILTSHELLIANIGAAMAGAIAIISGVWRIVKKLHHFTKTFDDFLEDWKGSESRPGVPARPGLMERISHQDETLKEINERLIIVETEVTYNNGKPLKDAVHRLDSTSATIRKNITELSNRMATIEQKSKGD